MWFLPSLPKPGPISAFKQIMRTSDSGYFTLQTKKSFPTTLLSTHETENAAKDRFIHLDS